MEKKVVRKGKSHEPITTQDR